MDHRFLGEEPAAGHAPTQGKRGCGRAHVIRHERARLVPTRCRLRAQDLARHQARRPARGTAGQIPAGRQPQDRDSNWAHDPGLVPSACRRGNRMKRREFIALFGGAAAWPLAARGQQPAKLPTIGYLGSGTPATQSQWVAAFVQRMHELGWMEGRTIAIEYRWAQGRSERAAEIAAEFARLKVDVIVTDGTPSVIAAKQATSVIPIVFAGAGDPVGSGLVASLARPGGNVT